VFQMVGFWCGSDFPGVLVKLTAEQREEARAYLVSGKSQRMVANAYYRVSCSTISRLNTSTRKALFGTLSLNCEQRVQAFVRGLTSNFTCSIIRQPFKTEVPCIG
jgi:hypothetical protein